MRFRQCRSEGAFTRHRFNLWKRRFCSAVAATISAHRAELVVQKILHVLFSQSTLGKARLQRSEAASKLSVAVVTSPSPSSLEIMSRITWLRSLPRARTTLSRR